MADLAPVDSLARTHREEMQRNQAKQWEELVSTANQEAEVQVAAPTPAEPAKEKDGLMGRAAAEWWKRVVVGGQRAADAIYPANPNDPRSALWRIAEFAAGAGTVATAAFPLGIAGGLAAGDWWEAYIRASGSMEDETLRARLEAVRNGGATMFDIQDAHLVEALLAMPSVEQRIKHARGAVEMATEMVTGLVPGYTVASRSIGAIGGAAAKSAGAAAGAAKALPPGAYEQPGRVGPQRALPPGPEPPPPPGQPALPPGSPPKALPGGGQKALPPGPKELAAHSADVRPMPASSLEPSPARPAGPSSLAPEQAIADLGLELRGITDEAGETIYWVHDPQTGSTGLIFGNEFVPQTAARRVAVSRENFKFGGIKDEAGLGKYLADGEYAVLSAAKSGLTPEQNAARMVQLEAALKERGYQPVRAVGRYQGDSEPSFLVPGLTEAEGLSFAKRFEQESILTRRGLVYTEDGHVLPPAGITNTAVAEADNFTQLVIGGKTYRFSVPFNFEGPAPAKALGLEHYSRQEGLTEIDPGKFGTGQAGREAARATEPGFIPRSYYYAEGAAPEARFGGMNRYRSELPAERIYDISKDPQGLAAAAAGDATKLEASIRDAGFAGYTNPAIEGTMGKAVAVFEKLPATAAGKADAPRKFHPSAQPVEVGADFRANYRQLVVNDEMLAAFKADLAARVKKLLGDLGEEAGGKVGAFGPGSDFTRTKEFKNIFRDAILLGAVELRRAVKPLKFKEWSDIMVARLGVFIRPHLRQLYKESQATMKLREGQAVNGLPATKHLLDLMRKGEHGGPWYHHVMPELEAKYGREAVLLRKFIAATSPMKNVPENVDLALKMYAAYKAGERFRGVLPSVRRNLKRTVTWWEAGADPNVQPLRGPKVEPFDRAMAGDTTAFVADRWIWRLFYGKDSGTPGQYEYMRGIAAREAQELGVSVRDLQAMWWVAFKETAAKTGKTAAERRGAASGSVAPLRDIIREKIAQPSREWQSIADIANQTADPAGFATSWLLMRMTIGAVAGGATGDTPEERLTNALVGAGLGTAASPALVRRLLSSTRTLNAAPGFESLPTAAKKKLLSQSPYQPNYNYIKGSAEMKAHMRLAYNLAHDRIAAGRQGVQTHDKTELMANELITSGKMTVESILAKPAVADPLPAHEITAARKLLSGVAEAAEQVADRTAAGNAVPGEIRRIISLHAALAERVSLATTGTARALDAHKIMADAKGVISSETVARFADNVDPRLSDMELAQQFRLARELDIAQQLGTTKGFLGMVGSFPEVFSELFFGSILWGKALGRNLFGNLTLEVATEPIQALARFMPKDVPFVTSAEGRLRPGIVPGEATAQLLGRVEGVRKFQLAAARLRSFDGAGGGKFELLTERPAAIEYADPNDAIKTFVNYFGSAIRGSSQILNKQDIWSKAHHINGRIHGMAHRRATIEGLTGDDFQRRAEELINDPTKFSKGEREEIVRFVKQDTSTMEIENPLAKAVVDAIGRFDYGNAAFRWIFFAFPRITSNVFETFASYTPGLNFLSARFYKAIHAGGADAQRAIAQLSVGTVLTGLAMYYADEGWVTGDDPDDPGLRRMLRIPGTDTRISYRGLGFLEEMLAFSANTRKAAASVPWSDVPKLASALVFSMWDAFDNLAFIQTFGEVSSILVPARHLLDPDTRMKKAGEFAQNKILSLVPFSGALRELRNLTDSTRREAKSFIDRFYNQMPLLSGLQDEHGNYKVAPRRDLIYGSELKSQSLYVTSTTPDRGNDPVWREVYDLTRKTGKTVVRAIPDHLVPGISEDDASFATPVEAKQGLSLTHEERDRLAVLTTQEVRIGGLLLNERMKNLIASHRYGTASDTWRATELANMYNNYLNAAKDRLMRDSPALRRELQRVKGENSVKMLPTDRQPAALDALRRRIGVSP